MKTKGKKSARPRFHVYFPHKPITNAKQYLMTKGVRRNDIT